MSERDTGRDNWLFSWILILAMVLGMIAATTVRSRSQLRDLQRRVGQLEEQVRR